MKQVKYLFIFIFFFLFTSIVNASTFEPRASFYEPYDGSGSINIALWYEGPSINEIESKIKYDATYFEVESIISYSFDVTPSMETKDGKYRTFTVKAISEMDYDTGYYAIISFKLKNNFKIGYSTYIYTSDYFANNSEGKKYKNDGLILNINYHSRNDVYLVVEDRTEEREKEIWMYEHISTFLLIVVIIFILLGVFLIMPHNYLSGNRSKRVKNRIKENKNNANVNDIKIDVDDIASIGEKPKEEPKNKLELGSYNPLESNKTRNK